jgi:peptidoglycan/xylan/chitin deacetylase (PgdA/CDA1 family)
VSGSERAVVLMYHRLGAANNDWERKYCVAPERFEAHMAALRRRGYRACSADTFVDWLCGRSPLPDRAFLLTFDDGFAGVHDYGLPVLASFGWPASVFLVSALLGKEDAWTRGQNPSGATYPLLDRHHVAEMVRHGFSFHSHSRTHADLTSLPDARLADELAGARQDLADLLGTPPAYLAYPYGRYDERVRRAAIDAGYAAAFSVQPGFNRRGLDPYAIRRLDVFGSDTPAALLRKVALGSNDGSLANAARYALDRAASHLHISVR